MSWFASIIAAITGFFSWEPVEPKNDLIENHIWLHNRVQAHRVEVIHVETKPISNAPYKK